MSYSSSSSSFKRTIDSVSRGELITKLSGDEVYDVVVIGGGIHGAAVARFAAAYGFKLRSSKNRITLQQPQAEAQRWPMGDYDT